MQNMGPKLKMDDMEGSLDLGLARIRTAPASGYSARVQDEIKQKVYTPTLSEGLHALQRMMEVNSPQSRHEVLRPGDFDFFTGRPAGDNAPQTPGRGAASGVDLGGRRGMDLSGRARRARDASRRAHEGSFREPSTPRERLARADSRLPPRSPRDRAFAGSDVFYSSMMRSNLSGMPSSKPMPSGIDVFNSSLNGSFNPALWTHDQSANFSSLGLGHGSAPHMMSHPTLDPLEMTSSQQRAYIANVETERKKRQAQNDDIFARLFGAEAPEHGEERGRRNSGVDCPRADEVKRIKGLTPTTRRKSAAASSKFRGVTKHRLTGRFEAQLWDPAALNTSKQGARPRGRQIYLGGYNTEVDAARAYDRAAIKFFGEQAHLNDATFLQFHSKDYDEDEETRCKLTRDEWVAHLRSQSTAFSRGRSKFRGVTRHHQGNWEARISGVDGVRYVYLGTYQNEEHAARSYDLACIVAKGQHAVLNYPTTDYVDTDTGLLRTDLPWCVPQAVYTAMERSSKRPRK